MALLASVRVGWVCDKDKKCLQILIDTRYLLKTTRTVQGTTGDQGWKTIRVSHCFFSIFNNSRKNNGHWPCLFRPNSSEALQSLQSLPMSQACTCGLLWAPGQTPSAPKQWMLDVDDKSQNHFSARSPLTKFRKEKFREHRNWKALMTVHWRAQCHCTATQDGSLMAKGQHRVSASCKNQTWLTATCLNH